MKKILLIGDSIRMGYPDPQSYHRPKAYPMDIDAYEKKGHIYVEKKKRT